jgi:hypothetical protein
MVVICQRLVRVMENRKEKDQPHANLRLSLFSKTESDLTLN